MQMCSSLRSETSLYTARIPCCIKMHGILRIVLHACMLALIMCVHCSFALNLTAIQSQQYPTCNMITGRFLHKCMYCYLCILCLLIFPVTYNTDSEKSVLKPEEPVRAVRKSARLQGVSKVTSSRKGGTHV